MSGCSIDVPDVLIVGAGPSGSTMAGLLARRGIHVSVLERRPHPRPKPCGEVLNPGAVAALVRLGLSSRIASLRPARIEGWRIHGEGVRAEGRFGLESFAWALPRARLDSALARWARSAGARIEERVQVRRVEPPGAHGWATVQTIEPDGSRGMRRARLVVGADGLRSLVARALGVPNRGPRVKKASLTCRVQGRMPATALGRLHLGDHGTVGIVPVAAGGDRWNVTVVVDPARDGHRLAADAMVVFDEMLEATRESWLEGPVVVDGPWTSGPFDRPVRRIVGDGVLLIGDAAGYYDPLTGQGIYRALRSAELAAGVVERALEARRRGMLTGDLLSEYQRRFSAEVRWGRALQKGIEAVVSRSALRKRTIGGLGRSPSSMSRLVRVTGDASPSRTLLTPAVAYALSGLPSVRSQLRSRIRFGMRP